MQAQLLEGLYLMLVGMSFVLGFLTLVVLSLKLLEVFAPKLTTEASVKPEIKVVEDTSLQAAITAAIHSYRKRNSSKD